MIVIRVDVEMELLHVLEKLVHQNLKEVKKTLCRTRAISMQFHKQ